MAHTTLIPAYLVTDLNATLKRLREARFVNDDGEIIRCEKRLNWLLDRIPRA